ncbi:hypothetical protein TWF694_002769 [Orbilia ellipsospora]|uniref:Large ribosomal subunit protein P1 n=1 Tax=Orbilia ellipsospora TaxID=2528407 RepID=A0AAV9WZL7_9PEZI
MSRRRRVKQPLLETPSHTKIRSRNLALNSRHSSHIFILSDTKNTKNTAHQHILLAIDLNLSSMATAELAVSYAALILADEQLDITAEKLQTLLKAASVDIEPIWTSLFAKALDGKDVKDLLLNVGSGGGAATAGGAPAAAGGAAAAAEETKEEAKEEEKEESDEDMGFGLFD